MSECPACGSPYSGLMTVKSGDRLMDTFPAPPYTTFKKYARICADPEDIAYAAGTADRGVDVYFHTYTDITDTVGPTSTSQSP